MNPTRGAGFKIIGADNIVYGPVELPVVVGWVKEERVTPETWVFSERDDSWRKAAEVTELKMFFQPKPTAAAPAAVGADIAGLKPSVLRRVKVLADFNDPDLQRFIEFMEVMPVRQFAEVVKQGQVGDAMYLILEGELRVRMMISGKESILSLLNPGDFFGEISLFDHGPRSADVLANKDSTLLKISAAAFQRLVQEAPELAAPFLVAMGKTLTSRIRADNKRFRDSVTFVRAAGQ